MGVLWWPFRGLVFETEHSKAIMPQFLVCKASLEHGEFHVLIFSLRDTIT